MTEELNIVLQSCLKQDRKAQEKLYNKFSPMIFGVCRRYFSSYDDAQECLQESFIIIFKKLTQFQNKGSFEGWIRRITVNVCVDKLRGKTFFVVTDEIKDESTYEEDYFEEDDTQYQLQEVMELLKIMPERYKAVFNLYIVEEYSHKEIAEMLEISIGTSKSNLSRAKDWLNKNIKKKHFFHKIALF